MPPRIADILRRAEAGDVGEDELVALQQWLDDAAPPSPLGDALTAPPVDVADDVMAALALDAAFAPSGEALRAALAPAVTPVDVVDDVMAAITLDAAFAPFGSALREAVAPPEGLDIVGDILAAIDAAEAADHSEMEIAAFADGEVPADVRAEVARRLLRDPAARAAITAQAELGAAIRDAVRSVEIDAWPAVARGIGAREVDEEALWAPIGEALRDAVRAPRIDVAAAVMDSVAPPARSWAPKWFSFGSPVLVFAAAAALIVSILPGPATDVPIVASVFVPGQVNDAEVEDMAWAEGVTGGIIAPEGEGGIMVIVVDDSALAAVDAPSEAWL